MKNQPLADYLPGEWEETIVKALRLLATASATPAEYETATEIADALENDTWLLQTTTPPDGAMEWQHIEERN